MKQMLPGFNSWPPFSIDKLPFEVQEWMHAYSRAIPNQHPDITNSLLTIVIPCYNPNPNYFAQLLLSLQLQTDQYFDVVLVNDGSCSTAWKPILNLLEDYPWIKVVNHTSNKGISSALNTAISNALTPYAALVDQDDIIHPNTISLVKEALLSNPYCDFLYSDHIVFDDSGLICSYIPKSPWNPSALLEFNYLIHLTVVKCSFYAQHGGMSPQYDGIQDWEFYLRIASFLTDKSVEYIPLPLYAWRLSSESTSTSSTPKQELINTAFTFVKDAHLRLNSGATPIAPSGEPRHYKLSNCYVDHSSELLPCNILIFCDKGRMADISLTLKSLILSKVCFDKILVVLAEEDSLTSSDSFVTVRSLLEPHKYILVSKLDEIAQHVNQQHPLLSLRAGVIIDQSQSFRDLPGWLERNGMWELVTLPTFSADDDLCISAGYANGIHGDSTFLPYAQGISRREYQSDFATYNNSRAVDIPSPSLQLVRSSCLSMLLRRCSIKARTTKLSQADYWWNLLASFDLRCCCPADTSVSLSPSLCAEERGNIVVRRDSFCQLISKEHWQELFGCFVRKSYLALVQNILWNGPGRVHPLYYYLWLNNLFQSSSLMNPSGDHMSQELPLSKGVARPLVILIPTEVNPRSHGHACLLTLALQLSNAGINVYLLPFNPYRFFKNYYQSLPPRFRDLLFIAHPSDVRDAVLLLPESTPPQLVKELRPYYRDIIWWLLAPAGLLTAYMSAITKRDYLIPFSEFALPGQSRYLFVHPKEERSLAQAADMYRPLKHTSLSIAIYSGKGRLKPLPASLHRLLLTHNIIPITRSSPATKDELFALMAHCRGLISFDPLTNLSLEAARLGLPTFLVNNPFPHRCFTHFPSDLSSFITSDTQDYICHLQSSATRASLSAKQLYRVSDQSTEHIRALISYPCGNKGLQVDEDQLTSIHAYLAALRESRSIQVANDGQAASSIFFDVYLESLKAPYSTHLKICSLLKVLDDVVEVLDGLNLYPLIRHLLRCVPRIQRLLLSRFSSHLLWLLNK